MNLVIFKGFGEDKDIIKADHYEDVSHISEDVVHKGLKHSGCIGEPHRHNQGLERAIAHSEGGFPLMASCDVNIVVASTEVELGVDLCAAQLFKEVGDERNQVPILLGDLVQVPEVHAESQGAILFLGKEDRGTGW